MNPHNTLLTAGGSSGGEGALVALRGSVLGVGTDIAGSIRIPSLCCGIYGFRPTADRIPFGGQVSPTLHGIPGIIPVAGPLATSLSSLRTFMEVVTHASPAKYDCTAVEFPWRKELDVKSRFKFGILPEDTAFPLHPPVRRSLDSLITKLRRAGHEVVYIPYKGSTSVLTATRLAFSYFNLDPTQTALKNAFESGEPLIQSVANGAKPVEWLAPKNVKTIEALAELNVEREQYSNEWRKLWVAHDLDIIIAPTASNTACRHDQFGLPPYTVIWNLLDVRR